MFSLREVAEDQFICRCHGCGWESAPMTTEMAIQYPRTHVCQLKVSDPIPDSSTTQFRHPSLILALLNHRAIRPVKDGMSLDVILWRFTQGG
jgi:hypothetical protein